MIYKFYPIISGEPRFSSFYSWTPIAGFQVWQTGQFGIKGQRGGPYNFPNTNKLFSFAINDASPK